MNIIWVIVAAISIGALVIAFTPRRRNPSTRIGPAAHRCNSPWHYQWTRPAGWSQGVCPDCGHPKE